MKISVIDHINEMAGPEAEYEKFDCLGLLAAKDLDPNSIERSIHKLLSYNSRIRRRMESTKIHFKEENGDIVGLINDKRKIWITKIYDSFYLAIFGGLSRNESEKVQKIILRIPWIVSSWLKPEHLDMLYREESFVKEYDRVTVQKEYDPYFLRKRYSNVPARLDKEEELFFEGKVEVRVRAPKVAVDRYFSELLRKEIVETVKTKIVIHLSNPGNSKVTVDENTHIIHEWGEPLTTESFVSETFDILKNDMKKYDDYVPERKYTYREDGSLHLEEYNPAKEATFIFEGIPDKYSREELWIKLRNLLTYGDEKLSYSPHGLLLESKNLEFTVHTFLPVDRSEFLIHLDGGGDTPRLTVLPLYSSRIGLLTFHRILSKRIDWKVRLS
ncbi:MAG: hypothetical protein HXS48_16055 [Theionarchaea archaeon]|nr:hypothetical protein [Theionarchaea archaeon]